MRRKELTQDQVDLEDFLGFLDVEHFLGLRGKDTWSDDGNESQVIIKTLIGQILTEKTPKITDLPPIYRAFADKLQPGDRIITFNYDILLERACQAAGKRFRLAPMRYTTAGYVDMSCLDEVVILKMHGSIDWFDRKHYRTHQDTARKEFPNYVARDPIFNSEMNLHTTPLVSGFRHADDPLREVHRVIDIERLYPEPPWFLATPVLISPSPAKVVYSKQFSEFWRGQVRGGAHNFRMVIIGYSLPLHDDYARQVIYRFVTNYQDIPAERIDGRISPKEPLIFVDLCKEDGYRAELQKRYRFIDWSRAKTYLDGFNDEVIAAL